MGETQTENKPKPKNKRTEATYDEDIHGLIQRPACLKDYV